MSTLPPIYAFIDGLIRRAQPTRVICIGDDLEVIRTALRAGVDVVQFTSSTRSRAAPVRQDLGVPSPGTLEIRHQKLAQGIDIDASLLKGAIVVALDIVERLVTPAPLLKALGAARSACKFMLVSATDRVRATGIRPASKSRDVPRWSGEEFFRELVRCGFPRTTLLGFTSAHVAGHPKDIALAVAGVEAEHGCPRSDFRVGAVMNVFNEVDVLDETVRHLTHQGVEVHVIDNWSEDGTYELAQSLLKGGFIKTLSRFPEQRTVDYEWARQLAHSSEFAASLDVDWLLHYDADEIRVSPWERVDLRDAIAHVDSLGYTAIDFTVLDFRFTAAARGEEPLTERKHFEFARHPSSFVQVKAWKNRRVPVDLATHGGHEALFEGQRVYPLKFLTKHYSLRSPAQAARKVFRDRLPRIGKEKAERGWHVHFDQYQYLDHIEAWSDSEVLYFDERSFPLDYLVERLSGIGISREERVTLNRNTSAALHEVTARLSNRASALQSEIVARDENISEFTRQLGQRSVEVDELESRIRERDQQLAQLKEERSVQDAQLDELGHRLAERGALVDQLQEAAGLRNARIEELGSQLAERTALVIDLESAAERRTAQMQDLEHRLAERSALVTGLESAAARRDAQIESLHQIIGARDAHVTALTAVVSDRDRQVAVLGAALQTQAEQLATVQQAFEAGRTKLEFMRSRVERQAADLKQAHVSLAEKTRDVSTLQASLQERERYASALQVSLAIREQEFRGAIARAEISIDALRTSLDERDAEASSLSESLSDARRRLAQQDIQLAEKDVDIQRLHKQLGEHGATIERLHLDVGHRDRRVEALTHAVTERATEIRYLEQGVSDARAELKNVLSSTSWQLTKPLRFLRRNTVTRMNRSLRKHASDFSRWCWYNAPVPTHAKQGFKHFVFSNFPTVFRGTVAYRSWVNFTATHSREHLRLLQPTAASGTPLADEYVELTTSEPLATKPAKLICFYLPQFHSIPENDAWWGDGFTEWTNVRPARAQFSGHYQPHVPGDLGYYNLLDPSVQRRQVELAKLYGIEGFCFYFYWFGGTRLLETPTRNYLQNRSLTLPFCLCWANEDWSRRWDGLSNEVLIAQKHSPEDDLEFIAHVAQYMRDPRYIRVGGKPLLLVYRPCLLPSARETADRWRQWCRANGLGEIYLAYTQSFETEPPANYGFDAAIEFPPNNSAPPNVTDTVESSVPDFGCTVYDWNVFVERSEKYKPVPYKLFRSVCPAWDNTPRRKNRSTVFLNSNPASYKRWLENAVGETQRQFTDPDERLVFVNAWNEWAEGAHLEPDARYGYAYLQATRDALEAAPRALPAPGRRMVLVAHDAYPHGAQLLALHLARTLSEDLGFHVDLVCLGDGPLKPEYARFATVHDLAGVDPLGARARALADHFYASGHRSALVNTTVSGPFLGTLSDAGLHCVALIHELAGVIEQNGLQEHARTIARRASKVVFAAAEVASCFRGIAPLEDARSVIRPQGLYKRSTGARRADASRRALRERLGLSQEALVVLGVGYADHRKGVDLFVQAGLAMAMQVPQARWVWIGHWDTRMSTEVEQLLARHPSLREIFVFPGRQAETELFYAGADVLALTSREDPFPSVVLEAMDAALPVVGFEGAGGFVGLLNEGCGRLVPSGDTQGFAAAVATLLQNPVQRRTLGERGAAMVHDRFSFRHYVFDLLDLAGQGIPRVSVVVPNFNYEHYLRERLQTLVEQGHPIFEIIFLDDRSRDGSVNLAHDLLAASGTDFRIVVNEENSGSVFSQWKKGVDLARGDYVWIAEADDATDPEFLTEVMKGFQAPEVVLSYCESQQMDEHGRILADNYLDYVADIGAHRWNRHFVNQGSDEISEALSVKNTIPNVSGVVFKREKLRAVLDEHMPSIRSFRVAGDWLVYVLLLRNGKVAFSPRALNKHRRHSGGVTLRSFDETQLDEIRRMQMMVSQEFDIAPQAATTAKRYLDQLTKQFGLAVS